MNNIKFYEESLFWLLLGDFRDTVEFFAASSSRDLKYDVVIVLLVCDGLAHYLPFSQPLLLSAGVVGLSFVCMVLLGFSAHVRSALDLHRNAGVLHAFVGVNFKNAVLISCPEIVVIEAVCETEAAAPGAATEFA